MRHIDPTLLPLSSAFSLPRECVKMFGEFISIIPKIDDKKP